MRIYQSKTGRKNKNTKPQDLPAKFKAGFLSALDQRTDLAKTLRRNFREILNDIGGADDVAHVKRALIERFVWLEAILQTIEHQMAVGEIDKAEALGRWIQAVNSLVGLAKSLGLDRRAISRPWLGPAQSEALCASTDLEDK